MANLSQTIRNFLVIWLLLSRYVTPVSSTTATPALRSSRQNEVNSNERLEFYPEPSDNLLPAAPGHEEARKLKDFVKIKITVPSGTQVNFDNFPRKSFVKLYTNEYLKFFDGQQIRELADYLLTLSKQENVDKIDSIPVAFQI